MTRSIPRLERLGSIRILGVAGQGGMGIVYRGFDESLKRPVAVKVLLTDISGGEAAAARFLREGKTLAGLKHPNLLEIYTTGEHAGLPYMVTEWLSGQTLQDKVEMGGPVPPGEALPLILGLSQGVARAHAQGILHRDIKPENAVLEPVRGSVLIDFGLVKGPDSERLTQSGVFLGTAAYSAPEQILNASGADQRADVFSLGATLYFLLTGVPPVGDASTLTGLLAAKAGDALPTVRDLQPSVPIALSAIVARAMSGDRERRFASVTDLVAALEGLEPNRLGDEGLVSGGRRLMTLGGCLLLLLLSGSLAAVQLRSAAPSPQASTPPLASASQSPVLPQASGPELEESDWVAQVELAQVELTEFMTRAARIGPNQARSWQASVAELDSRLAHLAELPPEDAGPEAWAARGAALADRGRWIPALELLGRGSLTSDRCALVWGSCTAASQLAIGGDPLLAAPTLASLAARSPESPLGRLARIWVEILRTPEPSGEALQAWLTAIAEVQPEQPPRWLGKEVWIAAAFAMSRADAKQRLALFAPLRLRLTPYGQAPSWSHAFLAPYLIGWRDPERFLLSPIVLNTLELVVTHLPTQRTVRKLALLSACRGRLGALDRLGKLGTGARLDDLVALADQESGPPKRIPGGVIAENRAYVTMPIGPGQEAVRVVWRIPPGAWTLRLRGAPVDCDLRVRADGPPVQDAPGRLVSATLARDEQVSPDVPTDGIHQIVIEKGMPWPETILVTLELYHGPPQWISPYAVTPRFSQALTPQLDSYRESLQAGRFREALGAVTDSKGTELDLLRAALNPLLGVSEEVPVPPSSREEVRHALTMSAAEAALARRDPARAIALLETLLAEEPRYLLAWETLAWAHVMAGAEDQALSVLKRVMRADPRQGTIQVAAYFLEVAARAGEVDRRVRARFEQHAWAREFASRILSETRPALLIDLIRRLEHPLTRDLLRLAEAYLATGEGAKAKDTIDRVLAKPDLAPDTKIRLRDLRRRLETR